MNRQLDRQRIAAYAIVTREDEILLCRLAPHVSEDEVWHLPGGGVKFGEHPADAVVREVREETGLEIAVGEVIHITSAITHHQRSPRHALRLFYDGVFVGSAQPDPEVQEIGGSTVDARWFPLAEVRRGMVSLSAAAHVAIARLAPMQVQRTAAYGLVVSADRRRVLLTRLSARTPSPGRWTLPGGGIEHGEWPAETVAREILEETGLSAAIGELMTVHSVRFTGMSPSGRTEDFHGLQLIYRAQAVELPPEPTDVGGTTDASKWVSIEDINDGSIEVVEVVRTALALLD